VRIRGELDLAGGPALTSAMEEAERSSAARIFLDLEALTFIDAAGLGTILYASRRLRDTGHRLQITRGEGRVAAMFRMTLLDGILPLTEATAVPRSEVLV
jgi:anti-sigma B factor antagonist